jgi:hypothetical protein
MTNKIKKFVDSQFDGRDMCQLLFCSYIVTSVLYMIEIYEE